MTPTVLFQGVPTSGSSNPSMFVSGVFASYSANNPVIFPTVAWDTASGYNNSTGVYTIPKTGKWGINCLMKNTINSISINVFVNGSGRVTLAFINTLTNSTGNGTNLINVNSGDTITICPDQNGDSQFGSFSLWYIGVS